MSENLEKIVICTGGFDPIHSGHINYLKSAKALGDKLIVGLNSDAWLVRKKGKAFMPLNERKCILENIKCVDQVLTFDDVDGSAVSLLEELKLLYPSSMLIFANGGDRNAVNIPETVVNNIVFQFGVGGENKANSSSWILEEWKSPKTIRDWGYYRILHTNGPEIKLKELTVEPGKSLSMQKHKQRNEFWFVSEGQATVYSLDQYFIQKEMMGVFSKHTTLHINANKWHKLCNETELPLKIIEIQYGENCTEEDIERKNNA